MSYSPKYVVARIDIGEPFPSRPRGFARTKLAYGRYEERFGGPVILEIDGEPGPQLSVNEAKTRVFRKMKAGRAGLKIRVHPDSGPHLMVKKIMVEDPLQPANIYATDPIKIIYAWTSDKFEYVYNNGLYVNKPLLHGTRPPDAWDAGVQYAYDDQAHKRVMEVFNHWHREALRYRDTNGREGLPINGAIGMTSIFGPFPYLDVRRYTGDAHVTHGHISGYPLPYGHGGEI